jgi:hypothetical protein
MVASVGSVEDASQDSNYHSEEWTPVVRKRFIKKDKKIGNQIVKNFKISNHIAKCNENAMRVLVGTADITNNTKMERNVPHKPRKVEAFKKNDNKGQKPEIQVTSKEFSIKKFEKLMTKGLQEVKEYYKVPNVSQSIQKLNVDLKLTIAYVDKQLELIDMLMQYKIERLPKDIRPYAELHFKKAFNDTLPKSVAENPKNFFRAFHYLGNQKRFASNYRKHLSKLFQDIKPVFMDHISFDDEYERFDTSTESFFHGKTQKLRKNIKNRGTHVRIIPAIIIPLVAMLMMCD